MAQRKARDLDTLNRLHNWTVDERRRELGTLLAREQSLIETREAMAQELVREQRTARDDPTEAGFIYDAYAKGHQLRREQLDRVLAALRGEIEEARERLADAYRQQKVFEEVRKERLRQEEVEESRKEQVFFDEIAQTQFRQKRAVQE